MNSDGLEIPAWYTHAIACIGKINKKQDVLMFELKIQFPMLSGIHILLQAQSYVSFQYSGPAYRGQFVIRGQFCRSKDNLEVFLEAFAAIRFFFVRDLYSDTTLPNWNNCNDLACTSRHHEELIKVTVKITVYHERMIPRGSRGPLNLSLILLRSLSLLDGR